MATMGNEARRKALSAAGLGVLYRDPIDEHLLALATQRRIDVVALGVCLVRADEAGPPLRALIEAAADGEFLSEDEETLLFRGLYILGGVRDTTVCAPLLRLLRLPDDVLDPLLGDAITESLPRIVAGVFDGDAEALFAAIADPLRDEYVRDALLGAATFLAWEGRIEAARMRRFLEEFDDQRLAEDGDCAWAGWLQAIARLGLSDLAPRVTRAFDDDRLPDNFMTPDDFAEDLAAALAAPGDLERLKRAHLGYIDDVYEALAWSDYDDPPAAEARDDASSLDAEDGWPVEPGAPVVNPFRHVGRNDPCPCGSGQKAKKCCLAG
jgi:hypothetical protein